MEEKPDEQDQGHNKTLSFEYLIECIETNRIDEWNIQYRKYLSSEWKRLYPEMLGGQMNILKLVRHPEFKKSVFKGKDFRETIDRNIYIEGGNFPICKKTDFVRIQLDGADFQEAHLEGANLNESRLIGADFTGAHLNGADFWGANIIGAKFRGAWLETLELLGQSEKLEMKTSFRTAYSERADFLGAHAERADFLGAHLEGSEFSLAHLEGAAFHEAHLEGATIRKAHLEETHFNRAYLNKTNFTEAYLEGATFEYAILDGETIFTKNTIDDKTDFTGTGLSAARIDPSMRTKLERNIREAHWKVWYKKPKFYPYLENILKKLWRIGCMIWHFIKYPPQKKYEPNDYPTLENSTIYLTLKKAWYWPIKTPVTTKENLNKDLDQKGKWKMKRCWIDRVINAFIRVFWWLSDYGSSTKRVIGVFFIWNILWAVIYQYFLPFLPGPILPGTNTTVLQMPDIITAVLQTNLMMFSITDLATEGLDYPALIFVTIHIVIGYFILAALITRLGIMFQNLSP